MEPPATPVGTFRPSCPRRPARPVAPMAHTGSPPARSTPPSRSRSNRNASQDRLEKLHGRRPTTTTSADPHTTGFLPPTGTSFNIKGRKVPRADTDMLRSQPGLHAVWGPYARRPPYLGDPSARGRLREGGQDPQPLAHPTRHSRRVPRYSVQPPLPAVPPQAGPHTPIKTASTTHPTHSTTGEKLKGYREGSPPGATRASRARRRSFVPRNIDEYT